MPKNLNSATRLHNVLKQASAHAENAQVLEVWAKILGVDEKNQFRRVVVVGELVHAMHHELAIASDGLSEANFSEDLYAGAFARIEYALSPLLFPASWNQVKQYLTSDVLTALAFCTEILPDEESQISTDELGRISQSVDDLRSTLSDASVPKRLRKLVEHHIELIEKALKEYPLVGAKALRAAGRAALGEIIEAKDDIAPAKGSKPVSSLEAAWKSVNSAADKALKAEKLHQLGQRAWDAIAGMF